MSSTPPELKFEFTAPDYTIKTIDPHIEQKRGQILHQIQEKYKITFKKYVPTTLIKGKHDADRVIETSMARFIMHCLARSTNDPVVPVDITDDDLNLLKNDVNIILNRDKSLDPSAKTEIITKIFSEISIKDEFTRGFEELIKYYDSHKNKNTTTKNTRITKTQQKHEIVLDFAGDQVKIPVKLYEKVVNRYQINTKNTNNKHKNFDLDTIIWCLIKRYIYLKSYNQQLAVHPTTMKQMQENYGVQFELFGSVLNTFNTNYCSLFYDLEKYFGSKGSLYYFTPISGAYSVNPPFDEMIIKNTAQKLVNNLSESQNTLRFFIWIPIWDAKGIETCAHTQKFKKNASLYGEYEGLKILDSSSFVKTKQIICIDDITYFNYMYFKPMTASDTYLIIADNFAGPVINPVLNLTPTHGAGKKQYKKHKINKLITYISQNIRNDPVKTQKLHKLLQKHDFMR